MQNLYLRLLVNENGNSAGYYKLNLMHLASDMMMTEDELIEHLKTEQKYWMYDEETEQVLIPKYTKYNMVKGRPQETKLNADLNALTPCRLHKEFIRAWEQCQGTGASSLLDPKFVSAASIYN